MLLITCPWCGPRAESEFSCGGEAHIVRPLDTDALDDKQWGDYLFMRKNPKGQHFEQWHHSQGCRRWFNAERDTVTYRFKQFYKPGEQAQGVVPEGLAEVGIAPAATSAPGGTGTVGKDGDKS
jgi:sarcosine oxidase subunit delta